MLVGAGGGDIKDDGDFTARVLMALSTVLERIVSRNDRIEEETGGEGKAAGGVLSAFNGVRAPSISISQYLDRIYKYTKCSPSCLVMAYVYMDRLVHRHPSSLLLSLNVHRLLVTSIMVASKVLDDEHYNNAFFARVGGVSNVELNRLELELLFMLDFGVMVSSRVFDVYSLHLEKEMIWNGIGQKVGRAVAVTSLPYVDDDAGETEIPVGDDYVPNKQLFEADPSLS